MFRNQRDPRVCTLDCPGKKSKVEDRKRLPSHLFEGRIGTEATHGWRCHPDSALLEPNVDVASQLVPRKQGRGVSDILWPC